MIFKRFRDGQNCIGLLIFQGEAQLLHFHDIIHVEERAEIRGGKQTGQNIEASWQTEKLKISQTSFTHIASNTFLHDVISGLEDWTHWSMKMKWADINAGAGFEGIKRLWSILRPQSWTVELHLIRSTHWG